MTSRLVVRWWAEQRIENGLEQLSRPSCDADSVGGAGDAHTHMCVCVYKCTYAWRGVIVCMRNADRCLLDRNEEGENIVCPCALYRFLVETHVDERLNHSTTPGTLRPQLSPKECQRPVHDQDLLHTYMHDEMDHSFA